MHTLDSFNEEIHLVVEEEVPHRHYKTARGTGSDGQEVRRRLALFNQDDPLVSHVRSILTSHHPGAVKNEFIALTEITILRAKQINPTIPSNFGATFDRITRRNMDLIIKWYCENWIYVQSLIMDITLCDEFFQPIQ